MVAVDVLTAAVRARDANEVRRVIADQPALAGERPAKGPSPLLMAAYVGDRQIADLLRAHTEPDLYEASALGEIPALAGALDRHPEQINSRSGDGWTPLHLAAFFGHAEAAELLLARGAALDALSVGVEANQPLHAALAGARNPAVVRALLAHGANVNAVGATGITPLHIAASRGDQAVIDILLEHGANRSAPMDGGRTPADLAEEHGHAEQAARLRRDIS